MKPRSADRSHFDNDFFFYSMFISVEDHTGGKNVFHPTTA